MGTRKSFFVTKTLDGKYGKEGARSFAGLDLVIWITWAPRIVPEGTAFPLVGQAPPFGEQNLTLSASSLNDTIRINGGTAARETLYVRLTRVDMYI